MLALIYSNSFGCASVMCHTPKYLTPFQIKVKVAIKTKEETKCLCCSHSATCLYVNQLNRREGHPGGCLESRLVIKDQRKETKYSIVPSVSGTYQDQKDLLNLPKLRPKLRDQVKAQVEGPN